MHILTLSNIRKKKKKTKTVLETKEEDDDTVQQVMDLTKKKGKGRIITSGKQYIPCINHKVMKCRNNGYGKRRN